MKMKKLFLGAMALLAAVTLVACGYLFRQLSL